MNIDDIIRGADAAVGGIIRMLQEQTVKMTARGMVDQALVGFLQAIVEHRQAVVEGAVTQALMEHPDAEKEAAKLEEETGA